MRTNVVINDELLKNAMELSGQSTRKATIEEALKLMVNLYQQAAIRKLKGKLHWEGNLEQMREGRFIR